MTHIWPRFGKLAGLTLGAGLFLAIAAPGSAQTSWTWANNLPQGNTLRGAAYGNGKFVAVGDRGTTITSTDGIHWTVNPTLGEFALNAAIFANGAFMTVGTDVGDAPIRATSTDGVNWSVNTQLGQNVSLPNTLAYGNGTYIAAGVGGALVYSTNGTIWSSATQSPYTGESFTSASYGNGVFVAVGAGIIGVSSDGIHFTVQQIASGSFGSVAFGNGVFVAVGPDGSIAVSTDGVNWTLGTADIAADFGKNGQTFTEKIGFANGQFILPVGGTAMFSSADGVNWSSHLLRASSQLYASAYGNGAYVFVGSNGAIFYSADGMNWSAESTSLTNQAIYGGAVGGTTTIVVGESGKISSTQNGGTWTPRSSGTTKTLYAAAYGAGNFVAVGDSGVALWSPNGTAWSAAVTNTNLLLQGVAFVNGGFVAVGASGAVLTSLDGKVWTLKSTTSRDAWTSIAYGNGLYAATAASGQIFTSADTVDWTPSNSGFTSFLSSITYAAGKFVASGWAGTVITSTNGSTWAAATPVVTGCLDSVIYNGNASQFIASGSTRSFVTSPNGVNWTAPTSYYPPGRVLLAEANGSTYAGTSLGAVWVYNAALSPGLATTSPAFTGTDLHAVTFANSLFVAVGDAGAIFASSDGLNWSSQGTLPGNSIAQSVNNYSLEAVTYGGGKFVAVGGEYGSAIFTSSDGLSWTFNSATSYSPLKGVCSGNGSYVAVGNSGQILYSTNGSSWSSVTSGVSDNFIGVAYGNGIFVALSSNHVLTSSNGTVWSNASYFGGIAISFENGLFVIVGNESFSTSANGVNWASNSVNWAFNNLTSYAADLFRAVASSSDGAQTYVSRDASHWYADSSPSPMSMGAIRGMASNGSDTIVAVGDNGVIMQGTPAWSSPPQWRTVYFDTAANSGNGADTADPKNDGTPNLLKYALGASPLVARSATPPAGQIVFDPVLGLNYLALTVQRNGIAGGVTYIVEVSDDLMTWSSDLAHVTALLNTPAVLQVRDNTPVGSAEKRFIRLRITDP